MIEMKQEHRNRMKEERVSKATNQQAAAVSNTKSKRERGRE